MGMRSTGAPQAPKAPLPEFAAQRKKVEQRINADTQGQQDAMQRRFAAQGMLNSGAAIKQQGILANQAQQNREDALGQVDAAEMGEMARRQEIQDNRDFMSNESKLGRDFGASESALSRAFQAGESKLGRDQQGSQFDRTFAQQGDQFDRNFAQQGSQFDRTFAQQGDQFNKTFSQNAQQFKDTFGLQKQQVGYDRQDQTHNLAVAASQMDDKDFERYRQAMQSKGIYVEPRKKPQNQNAAPVYNGNINGGMRG
jgi:uncharacterized lipoprotein YehR (DUF1307 family)